MQFIKIKRDYNLKQIVFCVLYSQNNKYKNFRNIKIIIFIDKIYKFCYIWYEKNQ